MDGTYILGPKIYNPRRIDDRGVSARRLVLTQLSISSDESSKVR